MAWIVFFALVILTPIALLVWRRGSGSGEDGADPQAHRNYAADGGPTPHYGGPGAGTDNWGAGGSL